MVETPLNVMQGIKVLPKADSSLKTIELKSDKHFTYLITELSLNQKDNIVKHKKEGTLEIISGVLGIDCKGILLIGGTDRINTVNVGKYLGYFLGPDQGNVSIRETHIKNREIHYREYSFTKERQEASLHLINHCPDKRMSINSLKRVIKSEYCCIWKRKN